MKEQYLMPLIFTIATYLCWPYLNNITTIPTRNMMYLFIILA